MKSSIYLCLSFALFLLSHLQVGGTTIAPYENLAIMGEESDAVVKARVLVNYEVIDGETVRYRTGLEVLEHVKGSLQKGQEFELQNYRQRIGESERVIWGDLNLEEGKTYLLFLNEFREDLWQGQMLSYGAFQEQEVRGKRLLVPLGLGKEVQIIKEEVFEPLAVYKSAQMIAMLKESIVDPSRWKRSHVISPYKPPAIRDLSRAAQQPNHCDYLIESGSTLGRWRNMESSSLPVRYGAGGEPDCSNTNTIVSNALSLLNNSYQDVSLSNRGTHNYQPPAGCSDATGNNFQSWVNTNLGGNQHLLIQFDDPCSEITDLTPRGGVLAYGGLSSSGTHQANGETYFSARYGHVVVNEGVGDFLGCGSNYVDLLTHEIGHCLNIGHIANGAGSANMNGSCCNDISDLDIACFDFLYSGATLPVQVIDFWGDAFESSINLEWISASEQDNDYYTIEKIINGEYVPLGKITGAGNSIRKIYYEFEDPNPVQGTNHYRLSQTDLDGAVTNVKQVAIEYFTALEVNVAPNPVQNKNLIAQISTDQTGDVQMFIIDAMGLRYSVKSQNMDQGLHQITVPVDQLTPGMYMLEVKQGRRKLVRRFLVR